MSRIRRPWRRVGWVSGGESLPLPLLTPPKRGEGGGVPRQLFRGGTGHPHRVNSWTIGGFAQGIGALLEKTLPTPPPPPHSYPPLPPNPPNPKP